MYFMASCDIRAREMTLESVRPVIKQACFDCHQGRSPEGGLDLSSLPFDLGDSPVRQRWIHIHETWLPDDRITPQSMDF